MPFITRNTQGEVISIHREQQSEHQEFLISYHPEVINFLNGNDPDNSNQVTLNALRDSDVELARMAEDLVDVLIKKQVILFTDLPDAVQQKLVNRQKLRQRLAPAQDSIISDDEFLM